MRESLDYLSTENKRLCERVSMLESMVAACESGLENVKQYIRRDMLELYGIPVTRDEHPNEIVKRVVNLLNRGYHVHDQDIPSVTDCLPQRVKSESHSLAFAIKIKQTSINFMNFYGQLTGQISTTLPM